MTHSTSSVRGTSESLRNTQLYISISLISHSVFLFGVQKKVIPEKIICRKMGCEGDVGFTQEDFLS